MDIIGWLLLVEIVVSIIFIIWYMLHLRRHVKRSPAETALKVHLADLEAEKLAKATKKNKAVVENSNLSDNKESKK